MGWDRKARGPASGYFYKSVRVPDKPYPVKIYFGRGLSGQLAAAGGEERKQERQRDRNAIKTEQENLAVADHLMSALQEWSDVLTATWLILSNHHKRRGEWRRKRGKEAGMWVD